MRYKEEREFLKYKSLRDFTDEVFYSVLDRNLITDLKELAGICSEILRRQIRNKDTKPNSSAEFQVSSDST